MLEITWQKLNSDIFFVNSCFKKNHFLLSVVVARLWTNKTVHCENGLWKKLTNSNVVIPKHDDLLLKEEQRLSKITIQELGES